MEGGRVGLMSSVLGLARCCVEEARRSPARRIHGPPTLASLTPGLLYPTLGALLALSRT